MNNSDQERRHFSRIEFDGHCTINFQQSTYQAELIDICLTGALIHSSEAFSIEEGADTGISIVLGSDTRIELLALLVKKENDLFHFQLENIDLESIGHLRRLLELNSGDARLIERELHHLGEGIAKEH